MTMPRNTTQHRDVRALTGIRGIAASWVVLYHVHLQANWPALPASILRHGYLAVDVFFVLSGFVMAMSYLAFFKDGFRLERYSVFLIRRMARIYPLYIASVLGIALLSYLHKSHFWWFNWRDLIANAFLVSGWGLGLDINLPSWSVSTEFAAYLLFPLLVAMVFHRKPAAAVFMAVAAASALIYLYNVPTKLLEDRNGPLDISWEWSFLPVVRCLAGFVLGLVAYRAACVARVRAVAQRPVTGLAVVVALAALTCIPGSDLAFVALVPLLIICLAEGRGLVVRIFASPPVYFLGEISYAMYLLHAHLFRIRDFSEALITRLTALPNLAYYLSYGVFYVVLLGASYGLFRFFETPTRGLVRRLEHSVSRPSALQVALSELGGIAAMEAAPAEKSAA